MKSRILDWVWNGFCLILTTLLISSCISFSQKTSGPDKANSTQNRVAPEELHAAVISYANRFFATIAQASVEFEKALPTPGHRCWT
ncbi:MAG: hypothetical protein HUK40_08505 [Desulfobacter sp.]|nr:hypothetical protein [Desulfobacter sp.]WDP84684.1 MAG: hypothetical protein HUN05_05600 [Desulfobacter sp.]